MSSTTPLIASTTITPTDEQQQALDRIVAWWTAWHLSGGASQQEFILDGGAGTGKSTVAGLAAQRLGLKNVVAAAYTAKAAKVMHEKGLNATTLHRLLYYPTQGPDGNLVWTKLGAASPAYKADIIILDECSMAPMDIANDLRSFGKPILVLGDVDGQLPPPQGAGAFLGRRPDFTLREPQRIVADSPIGRLAWIVRKGGTLRPGNYGDAVVKSMLSPDAWDLLTNPHYQVIVGKNKNRSAVISKYREQHGFASVLPEVGEQVICCRNNYRVGLINGDTGIITRLYNGNQAEVFAADVEIDGKGLFTKLYIWTGLFNSHHFGGRASPDDFARSNITVFDWSYALTAHKAQGSEYDHVIVVDDKFGIWDADLRRRWLYTALTRARKTLTVLQAGR